MSQGATQSFLFDYNLHVVLVEIEFPDEATLVGRGDETGRGASLHNTTNSVLEVLNLMRVFQAPATRVSCLLVVTSHGLVEEYIGVRALLKRENVHSEGGFVDTIPCEQG